MPSGPVFWRFNLLGGGIEEVEGRVEDGSGVCLRGFGLGAYWLKGGGATAGRKMGSYEGDAGKRKTKLIARAMMRKRGRLTWKDITILLATKSISGEKQTQKEGRIPARPSERTIGEVE